MILIFDSYKNNGKDIVNNGKQCKESGVSKVIISFVSVKNDIKLTKFIKYLNDISRN